MKIADPGFQRQLDGFGSATEPAHEATAACRRLIIVVVVVVVVVIIVIIVITIIVIVIVLVVASACPERTRLYAQSPYYDYPY